MKIHEYHICDNEMKLGPQIINILHNYFPHIVTVRNRRIPSSKNSDEIEMSLSFRIHSKRK